MSDAGTDSHSGLHYSRIDRVEVPRGCALSWTIGYMNHFAPAEARLLWQRYKRHYKLNWLLFAGFREYPKGFRGKEDDDSGPIVFGAGAAATGFGLKAARGVGDFITYYQIRNTLLLSDLVLLAARIFKVKLPRRMVDICFSPGPFDSAARPKKDCPNSPNIRPIIPTHPPVLLCKNSNFWTVH